MLREIGPPSNVLALHLPRVPAARPGRGEAAGGGFLGGPAAVCWLGGQHVFRPAGDHAVKLVLAVIQPTKLNAVREALEKIEVTRLTVCDAQGFGRQRGRTEMFRGHEYTTTLLRKVVLKIVVNDDFLERTIETISSVARTGPEGTIGDGKIFVVPSEEAVQVNDGARGPGAV
jgi:nitrogen regulatory protein P-II 2